MIKAILTTQNTKVHKNLTDIFHTADIQITLASSGAMAITLVLDSSFKLLIADDLVTDIPARQLIEKAITQNPFLNCAVISSLEHDAFHEEYEGLGVLTQLQRPLKKTDILTLADQIKKISNLMGSIRDQEKETSQP